MASINTNSDESSINSSLNADNNGTAHLQEWTFLDIQHLLRISKAALPANDILNYTTAMSLLDWNRVKFGAFTANDCKAKLLEVMKIMRCHRTLTEILSDAQNFFKFQVENIGDTDKCQSEFETTSNTSKQLTAANSDSTAGTENGLQLQDNTSPSEEIREDCSQKSNNSVCEIGLSSVLKHTNWCDVVVNCGDKLTAIPTDNAKGKTPEKQSKAIASNDSQKINMKTIRFPLLLEYLGKRRKLKEKQAGMSTTTTTVQLDQEAKKTINPDETRRCLRPRVKAVAEFRNTRLAARRNSNNGAMSNQPAISIGSFSDARNYWGYMLFAKQNLNKLMDIEPEDKLDVIYKMWQGLEDEDKNDFTRKGLRKTYNQRDSLQFYVLSKVKI